jgi:DNA-binding FrmR family transcriptional regulator
MHTFQDRVALLKHVRQIRGEIEVLEQTLEADSRGSATLRLIARIRDSINGLTGDIMEDYVRDRVVDPADKLDLERSRSAEWLVCGMRRLWL